MRSRPLRCAMVPLVMALCATPLRAQARFDNAEYAARRAKLMAQLPDAWR